MTERTLKPILISFSLLSAFLLHIVIAEPQVYEQMVQPALLWVWEQLDIVVSCMVGRFLEITCWIPLGTIVCCFLFSLLVTFILCGFRYPFYWLCPIVCGLAGWILSQDSSFLVAFLTYSVPALFGTIFGGIKNWQNSKK